MTNRFAKLASSVALASAMFALSGAALAVDEINKSGGVIGRQLQIIERDDEAKNERGVQIAGKWPHFGAWRGQQIAR